MPTFAAHAKLNLFLRVLAREATGYHQIETLFCRLELADTLEIRTAETAGIELSVENGERGDPRENLVHRAATLFYRTVEREPALHIALHKRIPAGAGLGGGSSDAASTLRALNELSGSPLPQSELFRLGRALGSDVAFFLTDAPLALAWGRGDRLLELAALPRARVLLMLPDAATPTAGAYAELAARRERSGWQPNSVVITLDRLASWSSLATFAANDFEPQAFDRFPELGTARQIAIDHGARLSALTGSGSCYFAIFDERTRCEAAAAAVKSALPRFSTMITETCA